MASFWPLLVLTLSLLLLHPLSLSSSSPPSTSADLFTIWCSQHGRTYSSEQDRQRRLRVFEDNLAFVTQHNNLGSNSSYTLSLNAFADLTHHEFKSSRLGLSVAAVDSDVASVIRRPIGELEVVAGDVPSSVDWRKSGAVTKVKDQGSCGM